MFDLFNTLEKLLFKIIDFFIRSCEIILHLLKNITLLLWATLWIIANIGFGLGFEAFLSFEKATDSIQIIVERILPILSLFITSIASMDQQNIFPSKSRYFKFLATSSSWFSVLFCFWVLWNEISVFDFLEGLVYVALYLVFFVPLTLLYTELLFPYLQNIYKQYQSNTVDRFEYHSEINPHILLVIGCVLFLVIIVNSSIFFQLSGSLALSIIFFLSFRSAFERLDKKSSSTPRTLTFPLSIMFHLTIFLGCLIISMIFFHGWYPKNYIWIIVCMGWGFILAKMIDRNTIVQSDLGIETPIE